LEAQYQQVDDMLGGYMDKFGIDLDNPDIDENDLDEDDAIDFEDLPPEIKKHISFVEDNALDKTARNYSDKAYAFLKETFYENKKAPSEFKHDFETLSWYHTLLPTKLHRALCGFREPASEGDILLYDAVAQFQICKKAITQSVEALRKITKHCVSFHDSIQIMLALLHNIYSRIEKTEESIG